jgi:hypothetical protein
MLPLRRVGSGSRLQSEGRRLVSLAFLSPKIIQAIADGTAHPAHRLREHAERSVLQERCAAAGRLLGRAEGYEGWRTTPSSMTASN